MKKYIVVATGYNFVEAEAVLADSKEDAIFRTNMKATTFVLCEEATTLNKFATNVYNCDSGWNCVYQRDGVEISYANAPFYNNQPYPRLDVCEAINRLVNPVYKKITHIILGNMLPKIDMRVCCSYDDYGDESATVYF